MVFLQVKQTRRVHGIEQLLRHVEGNKCFMDGIFTHFAAFHALVFIGLRTHVKNGIHQFVFVGVILVQGFFDIPNWAAISSMDTERIPYRLNSSFDFTKYSFLGFHNGSQNYGNLFRNQSFQSFFL